jgi:hypothetical protein
VAQSNFHGANAAIDISTALDNLAMAATTDRDIVAQLTTTNEKLVETNKTLTQQLKIALDNNTKLINNIGSKNKGTPTPTPTGRKPFDKAEWEAKLNPTGYCWTHGYQVVHGHTSQNCGGKLGGHKDAATRDNIMGGSTKGKT